jgi:signal peptidase I
MSATPGPDDATTGQPPDERGYDERATGGDVVPRRRRGHRTRKPAASGPMAVLRESVVVVVIALGLALVLKTFLVQAFYIPSISMEDTLKVGDRVVVTKLVPGPFSLKRGDVVVFTDPNDWLAGSPPTPEPGRLGKILTFIGLRPNDSGNHLIKRVIGLPGDHVKCCDSSGHVMVNGVPLDEPYLYPGDRPSEKTFDVTVPAGKLWVMGDHRSASEDSRYKGFVPEKLVTGRALVIVWPFPRADWLSRHASTFAKVDAGSS